MGTAHPLRDAPHPCWTLAGAVLLLSSADRATLRAVSDLAAQLPDEVFAELADQYRYAVTRAEANYENNSADEDCLTGGLSQSMADHVDGVLVHGGTNYSWETKVKKFRGRGPGALEKKLGADAIIELSILDEGDDVVFRKSLLFQAKKNWRTKDASLVKQVEKMEAVATGSIVVDYRETGYTAVRSEAVLGASGAPKKLARGARESLANILADAFLKCSIGGTNLYYDAARGMLVRSDGHHMIARKFAVARRMRSVVTKVPIR